MNSTPPLTHLHVWQQNLNKSLTAQQHLLNTASPQNWDILLLQEPWFGNTVTRASHSWRVLYPDIYFENKTNNLRSIILVNANLPTDSYEQIQFRNTDVTGIRIATNTGPTTILNVYNDCNHNAAIDEVTEYLTHTFPDDHIPDDRHVIMAGDFNRHHSWWEDEGNTHLTTGEALIRPLLDVIYRFDLRMALPPGIPTLQALSTGNWTRPDNVWCTSHTIDLFTRCDTDPGLRGPNTDHLPILSSIDLPLTRNAPKSSRNFRTTDWEAFTEQLTELLSHSEPRKLTSEREFRTALDEINTALKTTMEDKVPINKPFPHTKRWWTHTLNDLRKKKGRSANTSHRWRGLPDHPSHQDHREATKVYAKAIETSKKEHWENWLLNASERDIWTANKYATDPPTDGGKTRIPTLNYVGQDGNTRRTASNAEKSTALASAFFPPPPTTPLIPHTYYPEPSNIFRYFTRMQIKNAAKKLNAFKAPGPDGIPNIVLKRCIDILANRLYYIFRAIFELNVYPDEWRESITVVLRKPGKPSYEEPKAYRPIALLNTLGKLFSSIVADDLSHFCETREVLPRNQFGGRPARTTSDSMLLLTHIIKEKWRQKKVASVLFLDVQGAFPNVVKEMLIHNMRLRRVPEKYVHLVELTLTDRKTKLSFDDFTSDPIMINNGNSQGCPLSMIFYAFYNAGLLELSPPGSRDEGQFGFVDDVALLATGDSFIETHEKLTDMMERPGGAFDWSESHNSPFELTKLALMDFSPKAYRESSLTLTHTHSDRTTTIKSVQSYRFLGIQFDPKLKWKVQTERATRQAEAWINLIHRLARTSTGLSAKGMRQLYVAVAIPKMSYAADVWYTIPHKAHETSRKRVGSVKFTQKLQSAQRRVAITMLGAMRTTAGDVLNAHAYLPPPHLLFFATLVRSATRLASLPPSHPLHKPTQQAIKRQVKRHRGPLHTLFTTTGIHPKNYETILPARRRRNYRLLGDIHIDEDREVAIANANQLKGIVVYTDGSGCDKKVGAAAVMMKNGRELDSLHYHLGSETEHTVYEAEAIAVILALHLLTNLKKKLKKVTIGMDNQAVLLGMKNQKSKPGHYLMDKIQDMMEDFQVTQTRYRGERVKGYKKGTGRTRLTDGSMGWKEWRLKVKCEVTLTWTPGHEDIDGNERADKAAKAAASGLSSEPKNLPTFLRRKPLPVSVSATRQVLKKRMKTQWQTEWKTSKRYIDANKINYSLPSDNFLHIIDQLRRNQASLLTQLRTGHVPLGTVLHRIKRADTPDCPHCKNGVRETIHHFLLVCLHYIGARRLLQAKLRRDASSIPFLLGTRKGIPHLLRYVSNSQRLTATFGDVRPDDDFVIKEKKTKDKRQQRNSDHDHDE